MPAASSAEAWTKTSLPPSSGSMNPNPFAVLKNFTVPFMFASDVMPRHVRPVADPVNHRHFGRILDQWAILWSEGFLGEECGSLAALLPPVCGCLPALPLARTAACLQTTGIQPCRTKPLSNWSVEQNAPARIQIVASASMT